MKASTREWIAKAEEDFAVATSLARRRKKPLWGPLAFHAQQCVEKYLKVRLNEAGVSFGKTHNLEQLLVLALPSEPLWAAFQPAFAQVTQFAVEPRYPGFNVTKPEARQALGHCRRFRLEARQGFGLS
jgi:HEPN domain-containing protein